MKEKTWDTELVESFFRFWPTLILKRIHLIYDVDLIGCDMALYDIVFTTFTYIYILYTYIHIYVVL